MNPRYRRLLIPGLLAVLVAVVLITSFSRDASGATVARADGYDVVSTIDNKDIEESSGLVVSPGYPDLAYTINDSGNDAVIYAIRISTGKTVGTTELSGGSYEDTEALSMDNAGNLWIADTGDNGQERSDIALYSLPEPGEAQQSVRARRYPVTYSNGPQNVETLVISPKTNKKYLVSKGALGGEVYPLPDELKTGAPNTVTPLDVEVPLLITDGTFSHDGRYALLRTTIALHVFDAADWHPIRKQSLPVQEQGETLAMEPGGKSFLIGSEGEDSQLLRLGFSAEADAPGPTAQPEPPEPADSRAALAEEDREWLPWALGAAIGLAVAVGGLVLRRRR
ncbi:MAG: hypothetical protein M3Q98_16450 [Actinomycetota bacterium]|nr:hypothetical protein [Actinomycetota bacterium]